MSLSAGQMKLGRSLKHLRTAWDNAQPYWQDDVARRFVKDYLEPLEQEARSTLEAMERLGQVVSRAQEECE